MDEEEIAQALKVGPPSGRQQEGGEGEALAGHPPVNQLHVWWARRPLIASRAAVAASMLPLSTDRDTFISNLGTSSAVVKARNQMDAIKAEGG